MAEICRGGGGGGGGVQFGARKTFVGHKSLIWCPELMSELVTCSLMRRPSSSLFVQVATFILEGSLT